MTSPVQLLAAVGLACVAWTTAPVTAGLRPVTIDDEMKLRAVVDVSISPDGNTVAYVVSTPSLQKNEHEGALFIVKAAGGSPTRIGEAIRIFSAPTPRPQLRWSPDGAAITFLGFAGTRPQVFAAPIGGGQPAAV